MSSSRPPARRDGPAVIIIPFTPKLAARALPSLVESEFEDTDPSPDTPSIPYAAIAPDDPEFAAFVNLQPLGGGR